MARTPKIPPKIPLAETDKGGDAYHHGDLRTALIAAARSILVSDGLEALSLRAVARAAGVSQAAPYHHFANKDALLRAVAAQGYEELAVTMSRRMETESDPVQRLNATGVGYVAFAVANPELFTLMFGGVTQAPPGSAPELAAAGKRAYGVLQSAIMAAQVARGRSPQDAGLAGLWSWCGVHGLAKLVIEQKLDPTAYGVADAEALADAMLRQVSDP